ncbi:hypothetical protein HRR83_000666 [Exophiala dermatitidis]|uniref:Uncharacterized protein n=1 Tax=Exophiala dermatitidis TaxID=5970 RepID=A0AAN6J309_EXODE|nr:hypothetical protein HRR74_000669 [Exophiala dermatitidis]KAJ4528548.1 hypothetical protein HRR73_001171 [Exophiala dermatitidis]KAJ4529919.1 hypothetical protein HRR76_009167 [Exophiala dermatitidis]KAJ4558680.1 hypothetical protein HRR77_000667 [Exophiala dermatitidis]KAJ4581289.1 hypothetical protein HRR79_000331 [Exophiala dermatitidis]
MLKVWTMKAAVRGCWRQTVHVDRLTLRDNGTCLLYSMWLTSVTFLTEEYFDTSGPGSWLDVRQGSAASSCMGYGDQSKHQQPLRPGVDIASPAGHCRLNPRSEP